MVESTCLKKFVEPIVVEWDSERIGVPLSRGHD
jgi:hypothetical protein